MADPAVVPVEALRALVDKLPMFDPQWPDDLRDAWIAAFRTLMGFMLNQAQADALLAASASTPGPATFDFRAHLQRQREFSERTFGSGARTAGVVDHIRKELREIEADPTDASEWADVVILGLDGFWRAGYTPEQIIAAIVAKQTKNEGRIWPDWRTADPDKAIEHDRSARALTDAQDPAPKEP